MDFKAWNEINRAHDRIEALEVNGNAEVDALRIQVAEIEKLLKGEIQALKMRMGKMKEAA